MQPVSLASKNGQLRTLPSSVVETFRRGLQGDLMRPEDPGYDMARRVWNGMIDMLGSEANWERRADADANIRWARGLFDAMQPYSSGGVYLNFPGFLEDRDALVRAAYGENTERLREIKAAYDPEGLFPGILAGTA